MCRAIRTAWFAGSQLYEYDLTELTGLDDLHDPGEAIAEAEELLRDVYGSLKSYFLVNGSTVGNMAALLASCSQGMWSSSSGIVISRC